MAEWTWVAASSRGTSHIKAETCCEDAYSCNSPAASGHSLIGVLADGAGSALMGGQGASLVARTFSCRARESLSATGHLPTDDDIWSWLDEARDRIGAAAAKRSLELRDFASTLVFVASIGTETVAAHIGDGGIVVRCAADDPWQALGWPEHGEYASTTYFVTDEPAPRLRILRCDNEISAIVAFTDGLERLALDFAELQPHAAFFNGIVAPVSSTQVRGRDRKLCDALSRYLGSDAVNARTDDDKTLMVAVLR